MHINLLRRVLHEILLSQERSYKVTYDLQKMPVPSNSVGALQEGSRVDHGVSPPCT